VPEPGESTISAACEARLPGITRNPRPNRNSFLINCLYLVAPDDAPPEGLVVLDGLVGVVELLPEMLPLPVAPDPAPLRCSRRHLSRSVPVRPTHLAGTSVVEPVVAGLPL
jgi:hypothetical protein